MNNAIEKLMRIAPPEAIEEIRKAVLIRVADEDVQTFAESVRQNMKAPYRAVDMNLHTPWRCPIVLEIFNKTENGSTIHLIGAPFATPEQDLIESDGFNAGQFLEVRNIHSVLAYDDVVVPIAAGAWAYKADDQMIGHFIEPHEEMVKRGLGKKARHHVLVAQMAIGLCAIPGVRIEEDVEKVRVFKYRKKLGPHVRYKTLKLTYEIREQHAEKSNGPSSAGLHLVRGHFKDFSRGNGAFGWWKGTCWVPQHMRGLAENGVVVKEYQS